jgi:putative salt-induced outer membrane protein YdiY
LKRFLKTSVLAACLAGVAPGIAAPETATPKRLQGATEVAVINTTGNTEVLTLSLQNVLTYAFSPRLSGRWDLFALYGEQDQAKNAERYSTDLRGDYTLDARRYTYLLGGWLRDEFAGFRNRYYIGPGVGHKFIDDQKHLLAGEFGVNLTQEEYVTRDVAEFLETRLYGRYAYTFGEGQQFLQSLEYLQDIDTGANYKVLSKTALTSALTKVLALRIAYEIRYQNRPVPESLSKTDTIFSGSLVVKY